MVLLMIMHFTLVFSVLNIFFEFVNSEFMDFNFYVVSTFQFIP